MRRTQGRSLQITTMTEPNDQEKPEPPDGRDTIDEAAQDWFLLMTSGAPTEEDRKRFRAWQAADPRHQAVYDELCALWVGIDGLHDAFAPPDAAHSQLRPQRGEEQPPRRSTGVHTRPGRRGGVRFTRRQVFGAGLAAACVALVVATAPDLATRVFADHITGVGEQARIDLPDGSVAWLNTDTAISVDYAAGRRQISLLQGEAQFEVAKDAARPFAVMAREGRSTALGTVFSVRDDGRGAVVTVSEGTVEVASPIEDGGAPTSNAATAVLDLGEQVHYAEGAPPGAVRSVDPSRVTAWREGFIAIREMPLADALIEIDRYRPGRIVLLADPEGLEPVTARLSIASVDSGLDALAATHGLTVMRLADYLVLVR